MSEGAFGITGISTIDKDKSQVVHSQNDTKTKVNLVQYSSCLDDFEKVQEKKQSASALSGNKKLLKLAIYSKCQVKDHNYFRDFSINCINFYLR